MAISLGRRNGKGSTVGVVALDVGGLSVDASAIPGFRVAR